MIALMAAALFVTTIALCAMPSAYADDGAPSTFSDIRVDSHLVGTGNNISYTLYAISDDPAPRYSVRLVDTDGNTVSGSSATGSITAADGSLTRTTRAPADAGTYVLIAEFTYNINDEEIVVTRSAPVKVVAPIVLSATLVNNSGTVTSLNVWFVVDGNKVEGSDRLVTLQPGDTRTETYNWITDDLSHGRHTMTLGAEIGILNEGLIHTSESEFFIGQASHTLIEAITVIIFIVLLLILLFVYRKPVKNIGKPKARR